VIGCWRSVCDSSAPGHVVLKGVRTETAARVRQAPRAVQIGASGDSLVIVPTPKAARSERKVRSPTAGRPQSSSRSRSCEQCYRSGAVLEVATGLEIELALCRTPSWTDQPLLEDFQAAVGNSTKDVD